MENDQRFCTPSRRNQNTNELVPPWVLSSATLQGLGPALKASFSFAINDASSLSSGREEMEGKQNLKMFYTLFETLNTKLPKDILTHIQEPHPGPYSKIAL